MREEVSPREVAKATIRSMAHRLEGMPPRRGVEEIAHRSAAGYLRVLVELSCRGATATYHQPNEVEIPSYKIGITLCRGMYL